MAGWDGEEGAAVFRLVSGTKMRIFANESSQHRHYPNQHRAYTVADVFAERDMRSLEQLFVMKPP